MHSSTALLTGWHLEYRYRTQLLGLSHSAEALHVDSRTALEKGSDLGGDGAGRMSYVRKAVVVLSSEVPTAVLYTHIVVQESQSPICLFYVRSDLQDKGDAGVHRLTENVGSDDPVGLWEGCVPPCRFQGLR